MLFLVLVMSFQSKNRKRVSFSFTKPSMTEQNHKDSTDINKLIERHSLDILVKNGKDLPLTYANVSNALDYHNAQNLFLSANEQFASLPSKIRKNFDNNPKEFLKFSNDPKNFDTLVKMGLAEPVQKSTLPAAPSGKTDDA